MSEKNADENIPTNKYKYGQYVISKDKNIIFKIDEIYVNGDCFTYGGMHVDGRFPEHQIDRYKDL